MAMLSSKSAEEIGWMLDEYGIKHGPVVESTRPLYEKKLREAMAKQKRTKPQSDRTYYREEEEEEITYDRYRPQQYDGASYSRARSDYRGMDYTDESPIYRTQASYRTVAQARNIPSEPKGQTSENTSKRWVPIWIQILVFLILCGFLYVVFLNMESAEPSNRLT